MLKQGLLKQSSYIKTQKKYQDRDKLDFEKEGIKLWQDYLEQMVCVA